MARDRGRFKFFEVDDELRKSIEVAIRREVEALSNVLLAILFGSFVEAKFFRDIDLALYLQHAGGDVLELEWELSERFTKTIGYPVDVKVLNFAPPRVRLEILRRGIVVYARDDVIVEKLRIASLKELWDLELRTWKHRNLR